MEEHANVQNPEETESAQDHTYASPSKTSPLPSPEASSTPDNSRKRGLSQTDSEAVPTKKLCSESSAQEDPDIVPSFESDLFVGANVESACEENPDSCGDSNDLSESTIDVSAQEGSSKDPLPSGFGNYSTMQVGTSFASNISEEEINEIINSMGKEFDSILEEKAEKNRLTVKNVRSILRHVITNEYVLAMVRNTMKEDNSEFSLEKTIFEPKLTRSKAKELREKQAPLPWPVSTPAKPNNELSSNKLLDQEFSEDSSSDEEYKPTEEEFHSCDDDAASQASQKSPGAVDLNESLNPLVIADPEVPVPGKDCEADRIALRTRSKLPLTDTSLETIEASFVAPDITVDMYSEEFHDDEWLKFLCELTKPLDSVASTGQPDEDDPINDPEYNFLEEEEKTQADEWDFRTDKAVKVTKKEMKDLMQEILEAAEIELGEMEDEEEEDLNTEGESASPAEDYQGVPSLEVAEHSAEQIVQSRTEWMNDEERCQIEEQMRMHVQLLCQAFLMSLGLPELTEINESTAAFLLELKMFASRGIAKGRSYFHSHNLDEAVELVKSFRDKGVAIQEPAAKESIRYPAVPPIAKAVIARSKVFIYPELLPVIGFRRKIDNQKVKFTRAEDNLIVLGLEQFSFLKKPIHWIQGLLVPAKSEDQIRIRIKNCKSIFGLDDNPIKRWYKDKELPEFPRKVKPFDPLFLKRPCELPPEVLPVWLKSTAIRSRTPRPLMPCPSQTSPKVAVVKPMVHQQPAKRKYPPILPRLHVSPLKKINPILKKYAQRRRAVPVPSFSTALPLQIPSTGGLSEKSCQKIRSKDPSRFASPKGTAVAGSSSTTKIYPKILPKKKPASSNVRRMCTSCHKIESGPSTNCKNGSQNLRKNSFTSDTEDVIESVGAASSETIDAASSQTTVEAASSQDIDAATNKTDCSNAADVEEPDSERKESSNSKTVPDSVRDHDPSEDADDEAVDDEQDLAALMAASSTICRKRSTVRKNKQQRDLESTLALLSPDIMESDPKKEEREKLFAQSYLVRVMEALKDSPEVCEKFLKLLCSYEDSSKSPVQMFAEVQEILKDHPTLVDDFVGFLLPEQAVECGKFMEHAYLYKIRLFLRKLEVHFANQPHQIQKILRTLSQLQQQSDITSEAVVEAIKPLLKNQSHLLEEFKQLFPDQKPPECNMTDSDFEEITIPNSDEENNSNDSYENFTLPDVPDPYGTKDCPCTCHTDTTDTRMQNRIRHCVKCGIKFVDGKVYIQAGKVLKPAKIVFLTPQKPENPKTSQADDKNQNSESGEPSHRSKGSPEAHSKGSSKVPPLVKKQMVRTKPSATASSSETNVGADEDTSTTSEIPRSILDMVNANLAPETSGTLFPCNVAEDAVLPPESSSGLKEVPQDFSRLRDVISTETSFVPGTSSCSFEFSHNSEGVRISESSNFNSDSTLSAFSDELDQQDQMCKNSSDSSGNVDPVGSWTREQDKIVLSTCHAHGVNQEAFTAAAEAIGGKTAQEVESRCMELIQLFTKQMQKDDS